MRLITAARYIQGKIREAICRNLQGSPEKWKIEAFCLLKLTAKINATSRLLVQIHII